MVRGLAIFSASSLAAVSVYKYEQAEMLKAIWYMTFACFNLLAASIAPKEK